MTGQVCVPSAWDVFDKGALAGTLTRAERNFGKHYGMKTVKVPERAPEDFYHFLDRGSNVLAVAHLDTVVAPHQRKCRFVDTEDGLMVRSGSLDDRLGAYVILEMLPKLGIVTDVLLTVGEESGRSTAAHFEADRQYDHVIEFDRGGTDVVLYQYEDDETIDRVERAGAVVGVGAFSDTAFLEHLGCKAINWGVGYHDYHSTRGFAYLNDTFAMVELYRRFHEQNAGVFLEHIPRPTSYSGAWGGWDTTWEDELSELERWEQEQADREYEHYLDWDYRNADPTPEEIDRAMSVWAENSASRLY